MNSGVRENIVGAGSQDIAHDHDLEKAIGVREDMVRAGSQDFVIAHDHDPEEASSQDFVLAHDHDLEEAIANNGWVKDFKGGCRVISSNAFRRPLALASKFWLGLVVGFCYLPF